MAYSIDKEFVMTAAGAYEILHAKFSPGGGSAGIPTEKRRVHNGMLAEVWRVSISHLPGILGLDDMPACRKLSQDMHKGKMAFVSGEMLLVLQDPSEIEDSAEEEKSPRPEASGVEPSAFLPLWSLPPGARPKPVSTTEEKAVEVPSPSKDAVNPPTKKRRARTSSRASSSKRATRSSSSPRGSVRKVVSTSPEPPAAEKVQKRPRRKRIDGQPRLRETLPRARVLWHIQEACKANGTDDLENPRETILEREARIEGGVVKPSDVSKHLAALREKGFIVSISDSLPGNPWIRIQLTEAGREYEFDTQYKLLDAPSSVLDPELTALLKVLYGLAMLSAEATILNAKEAIQQEVSPTGWKDTSEGVTALCRRGFAKRIKATAKFNLRVVVDLDAVRVQLGSEVPAVTDVSFSAADSSDLPLLSVAEQQLLYVLFALASASDGRIENAAEVVVDALNEVGRTVAWKSLRRNITRFCSEGLLRREVAYRGHPAALVVDLAKVRVQLGIQDTVSDEPIVCRIEGPVDFEGVEKLISAQIRDRQASMAERRQLLLALQAETSHEQAQVAELQTALVDIRKKRQARKVDS
ncbi:MAG: hypothetical protein HN802_04880 [Candidatus Jacksonbacteria bacterium]|nr:hypothetical protein [Candidatus Jacksonbacteria bacterium]MBT6757737.1 hypothetical protein [Candidatus Jacksonbacteria bacterium]MBT6955541.1 hypothetical protein [Candidatus Jacksonbacteria bacterium]MBT7339004.1 hypothetical protein [Candidatus Jacksonbacteria bacterium]